MIYIIYMICDPYFIVKNTFFTIIFKVSVLFGSFFFLNFLIKCYVFE